MSYMNTHAAFAPAGGIQELSFDEIEAVGGCKKGFFERVGEAFDNPGATIGRGIDNMFRDMRVHVGSGKGLGYWAEGVYHIK